MALQITLNNITADTLDDIVTYVQTKIGSKFYILQTGAFTGPITGTVEFTPTNTITILAIEASISSIEATNIVFAVLKNGVVLQEFTIPAGSIELQAAFINNTITSSDIITLNIISGSGQDLVAQFTY